MKKLPFTLSELPGGARIVDICWGVFTLLNLLSLQTK